MAGNEHEGLHQSVKESMSNLAPLQAIAIQGYSRRYRSPVSGLEVTNSIERGRPHHWEDALPGTFGPIGSSRGLPLAA